MGNYSGVAGGGGTAIGNGVNQPPTGPGSAGAGGAGGQMNLTSQAAPGNTSVGGIMQMRSLRQVEADRQEALQEQAVPELTNLAAYVKKCWWVARAS